MLSLLSLTFCLSREECNSSRGKGLRRRYGKNHTSDAGIARVKKINDFVKFYKESRFADPYQIVQSILPKGIVLESKVHGIFCNKRAVGDI